MCANHKCLCPVSVSWPLKPETVSLSLNHIPCSLDQKASINFLAPQTSCLCVETKFRHLNPKPQTLNLVPLRGNEVSFTTQTLNPNRNYLRHLDEWQVTAATTMLMPCPFACSRATCRRRIAVKESLDDDIHQRPFVRKQVIEDHNHIHQRHRQQQQQPDQTSDQQSQRPTVEISTAGPSPANANNGIPDAAGQPSSRTNGSNQRLTTLESEPVSISPSRRRVPAPWPVQQEHRRVPCATPVSPHRIPGGGAAGGSVDGGYVGGPTSLWTSKDVWENHRAGRKQFRDNAARPPSAIGAAGVPWALG